ncbi:MAG: HEAT repeat domain-containing protein [Planctomycetota bacterium]|jgi:hypothetical protein
MKYAASIVVFIVGLVWAEEVDPVRLLTELTAANKAKDAAKIGTLLKGIAEVGKVSKDQKTVDALAKELGNSFKVCKGNWGTLRGIADTLGELRSKSTVKALKRYAYRKKAKDDNQESIQIRALLAIGKMADPKQIEPLGDQCKNRKLPVATAAYTAFKHYGTAKGKTRKRCAEILMKRLEAEYPSGGGQQGGGTVSQEAQERWQQLSNVIVASMQAVCHEPTINDVDNWREWWKENKRRSGAWKDKA